MGGARISRAGSKKWRDTQGMKLELLPVGDIVPRSSYTPDPR